MWACSLCAIFPQVCCVGPHSGLPAEGQAEDPGPGRVAGQECGVVEQLCLAGSVPFAEQTGRLQGCPHSCEALGEDGRPRPQCCVSSQGQS